MKIKNIINLIRTKIMMLTIIFEIVILCILALYFFRKEYRKTLGNKEVTILPKENYIVNENIKDAKYFYEPKPNTSIKMSKYGNTAIYEHNDDSLNERFDYSIQKPVNNYRIITLGDSFTYGLFVDTKDNYPERLEDLLQGKKCSNINKFEVINLGVGGYDINYAVIRYMKRGFKYNPDLLIWFLKNDDFNQIEDLIRNEVQANIQKGIPRFDEQKKEWTALQMVLDELNTTYGEENILNKQKEYLDMIRESYGGKILFLTLNTDIHKLSDKQHALLNTFIVNDRKSVLLSIDRLNQNNYFFPDSHPTKEGYKILSEDIFNYLNTENIIGCDN